MKNIFIDTNVVIDVFAERREFHIESSEILSLVARNKFTGFISALSFPNIHYILRKLVGVRKAIETLEKIKIICQIIPLDKKCIELALISDFNDFEDALQYYSALEAKCNCLITRDSHDYKNAEIPIFTPAEFLKFIFH